MRFLREYNSWMEIRTHFKRGYEIWYQNNKSFFLDIKLIFISAWVIFSPNSIIYEKLFKDLPKRSF